MFPGPDSGGIGAIWPGSLAVGRRFLEIWAKERATWSYALTLVIPGQACLRVGVLALGPIPEAMAGSPGVAGVGGRRTTPPGPGRRDVPRHLGERFHSGGCAGSVPGHPFASADLLWDQGLSELPSSVGGVHPTRFERSVHALGGRRASTLDSGAIALTPGLRRVPPASFPAIHGFCRTPPDATAHASVSLRLSPDSPRGSYSSLRAPHAARRDVKYSIEIAANSA